MISFAGQSGVKNGSTGDILNLLGRGYEAPDTHHTHTHTHVHTQRNIEERITLEYKRDTDTSRD